MELKDVFEPIIHFLKNFQKKEKDNSVSKDKAKERLQLVLMQDRASVSPDFFEMMKKEIIEVIKKYIEIDEELLEVQLTRGFEGDNESGPALYANIPIKNIKPVAKKVENKEENTAEAVPVEELSKEEVKEITDNIIEEIKTVADEKTNPKNKNKKKKDNVVEATVTETAKEEVAETVETNSDSQTNETVDTVSTEEATETSGPTVFNSEPAQEKQEEKVDRFDNIKEKFNDFKDGAKETISKAKTQAKDSIKKIKSKVKAKN